MPKIEDRNGLLTSVLCLLLLVSYHASRDALITVLPTISGCVNVTLIPPIEPRTSIGQSWVAVSSAANSLGRGGRSADAVLRNSADVQGYQDSENTYFGKLHNIRLEKELSHFERSLSELLQGDENDLYDAKVLQVPASSNQKRLRHHVATNNDNLTDQWEVNKTENESLKILQDQYRKPTEEEDTVKYDGDVTAFVNAERVEYLRQRLLNNGYYASTSLIKELLYFLKQVGVLSSSRNNESAATDTSSVVRNTLSISEMNSQKSSSDKSTSMHDVGVNVTNVSDKNENSYENAHSFGPEERFATTPATYQSPDTLKSELQLQKLMRLLDYLDEEKEENSASSRAKEEATVEQDTEPICESYEFNDLMFMSNWQLAVQGPVLGSLHLTCVVGLFIGHFCVEASTVENGTVGAVFTLQMAVLLCLTDVLTSLGAVALTALRTWQGLVQGACYPVVYNLLESKGVHRRLTLCIIFSGPWIGSILGTTMGTQSWWPAVFYSSGAVVLIVGILFCFIASKNNRQETPCKWSDVVRRDVLVSSLMHGGGTWVVHTILIASTIVVPAEDRWWVLLTVLLAGGLVAQLVDVIIEPDIPQPNQPARSHLLITTVVSFALTIVALLTLALEGREEDVSLPLFVILGGVVGTSFGYGVASIGYREVLEAVEAHRRSKALVVTNVAGALGASLAYFLVLPMVQAGGSGGYITGCIFPLSAVSGGAVCVFMFLLFPKTPDVPASRGRPSDDALEELPSVYVIPMTNGTQKTQARAPPDGMSQRSVDNRSFRSFKSFKSMMSTASFKTAVSRPRATSITTVYEDVEDDVGDDVSCKSIALESTDELQPQDAGGLQKLEVQASYSDLLANGDRTSAWLQVHHQLDVPQVRVRGPDSQIAAPKPLPGLLF